VYSTECDGLYRGKTFTRVIHVRPEFTCICESKAVSEDLAANHEYSKQWELPPIYIATSSQVYINQVKDAMKNGPLAGENAIMAWKAGCITADIIQTDLRNGEQEEFLCDCTETERDTTIHFCPLCGIPGPYSSIS